VAPGDEDRDHDDGRRQDQGGNDVDEGGQPGDRLFVPTDALDQISTYTGSD